MKELTCAVCKKPADYILHNKYGQPLNICESCYKYIWGPMPQGECKSCRHRDPEDKKCDCGAIERQGCPFPVSDDYYCKHYEKGGAE